MKNLGKIVLHIPAREGSKRVLRKNMRQMVGKPMIAYTIEASLKSGVSEHCYVNTDSEEIIRFVRCDYPKMQIYRRDKELCSDNAKSDYFNADIIRKLQPDILIMVNPVCPLIEAEDILNAVIAFQQSDCDTLITSCSTRMQTFCDNKPVNIDTTVALAPSQENKLVTTLNWGITIWDANLFLKRMDEKGFAVWGDKMLFYDIEPFKAVKVSEEKDFLLAELLLKLKD